MRKHSYAPFSAGALIVLSRGRTRKYAMGSIRSVLIFLVVFSSMILFLDADAKKRNSLLARQSGPHDTTCGYYGDFLCKREVCIR